MKPVAPPEGADDARRVETTSEEFVDAATGRRMRRVTRVTWSWADSVSRYHGDPDGWSGWEELHREVTVDPVDPPT